MKRAASRWLQARLALQILALLMVALVVAQITTLALTLLLPPPAPQQYRLDDIAAALTGQAVQNRSAMPLVRSLHARPPSLDSPGWLVSEQAQIELAKRLGVQPSDVRLLFYSPLPFAGEFVSKTPVKPVEKADAGASAPIRPVQASVMPLFTMVLARAGPGGGFGGRFPGGGFPGGGSPGGGFPGGAPGGEGTRGFPEPTPQSPSPPTQSPQPAQPQPPIASAPSAQITPAQPASLTNAVPAQNNAAPMALSPEGRSAPDGKSPIGAHATPQLVGAGEFMSGYPELIPNGDFKPPTPAALRLASPSGGDAAALLPQQPMVSRTNPAAHTASSTHLAIPPSPLEALKAFWTAPPFRKLDPAERAGYPLAATVRRSLFGLASTRIVEGEFVAAMRLASGQWATVQPARESFPNRWESRVLLWFAVSFAMVAPLGYLFARRLVAPLAEFSAAAEQLGRDPMGALLPLKGPAEIGRAALAFNLMQQRLKRYVDDRTAMFGAISHDLRTPLARMRFRIQRLPGEAGAATLRDIGQMEEMISSVLIFLRDASEAASRERVDLRSLLECVVDDAAMVGEDAVLDPGATASVQVDSLGVKRAVTNLVENAIKYGGRAQVSLYIDGGDAVTEIRDGGPGLAKDDLERVFLPFYRAKPARTLDAGGIGLGLAVSRSIARAHGGDVTLYDLGSGLVAQLRLPLRGEPGSII